MRTRPPSVTLAKPAPHHAEHDPAVVARVEPLGLVLDADSAVVADLAKLGHALPDRNDPRPVPARVVLAGSEDVLQMNVEEVLAQRPDRGGRVVAVGCIPAGVHDRPHAAAAAVSDLLDHLFRPALGMV